MILRIAAHPAIQENQFIQWQEQVLQRASDLCLRG
jgi:hypothetical protein